MIGSQLWQGERRLGGLRRFAVAITILNVLGHTWFGFEQPWVTPFVALAAAYSTELVLEVLDAWASGRALRFGGNIARTVDFLLSAHISGLAVSMLLYANERLAPVIFAAVVAVASKAILRIRVAGSSRHVMNPSNFGITVTLLTFRWVGIAPPYQFTENLHTVGDWVLPAIIVTSGSILNLRFTRRVPLLTAWLGAFVVQALVRSVIAGGPLGEVFVPALLPMTGLAFVLYTFYMVTDPATTPEHPRTQVAFGAAVGLVYGLLVSLHIVFGMFFALTIVSATRAVTCVIAARLAAASARRAATPAIAGQSVSSV